jgi:hypothetical protein
MRHEPTQELEPRVGRWFGTGLDRADEQLAAGPSESVPTMTRPVETYASWFAPTSFDTTGGNEQRVKESIEATKAAEFPLPGTGRVEPKALDSRRSSRGTIGLGRLGLFR